LPPFFNAALFVCTSSDLELPKANLMISSGRLRIFPGLRALPSSAFNFYPFWIISLGYGVEVHTRYYHFIAE